VPEKGNGGRRVARSRAGRAAEIGCTASSIRGSYATAGDPVMGIPKQREGAPMQKEDTLPNTFYRDVELVAMSWLQADSIARKEKRLLSANSEKSRKFWIEPLPSTGLGTNYLTSFLQ